ncbi:MAG: MarR family transcriptional regulator [Dehalococcoidales bacterium]|nr:MarR family transcriptional regulator [Dehalococcoidales bacterium]
MEPKYTLEQDGKALVSHILQLSNDIFRVIKLSIPSEWLSSDMTVAQLRVLLLLHTEGSIRMSSIASFLDVAVSTATGILDNLVKKELVIRSAATEDRRLVICEISPQGQQIINRIWTLGQNKMEQLLRGLSLEELQKADEVAEILLHNATSSAMQLDVL